MDNAAEKDQEERRRVISCCEIEIMGGSDHAYECSYR